MGAKVVRYHRTRVKHSPTHPAETFRKSSCTAKYALAGRSALRHYIPYYDRLFCLRVSVSCPTPVR